MDSAFFRAFAYRSRVEVARLDSMLGSFNVSPRRSHGMISQNTSVCRESRQTVAVAETVERSAEAGLRIISRW